MSITQEEYKQIGESIASYCLKYNLPFNNFFDILNDQKVVPMLRGKGMEYNAFLAISQILDENEWTVHKLNPNPQPGAPDQDISIIHKRSNIRLGVESKTAWRASMTLGLRARLLRGIPHFKVKCHRSRSNISLVGAGNDRYRADEFDVIITTPSNALFKAATISDTLELFDDATLREFLEEHYHAQTDDELLRATDQDWRFVLPQSIADANGFLPRSPFIFLKNDPNWRPLDELQKKLEAMVQQRWQLRRKPSSHS